MLFSVFKRGRGKMFTFLLTNEFTTDTTANSVLCLYIQGVSRLVDITAGGDFLGLCDQKCSYKHVTDFGRLRSYGHFLIAVHAFV